MREVLGVQIGQCGNRIGSKFWEIIAGQHSIDFDGKLGDKEATQRQYPDTYFHQVEDNRYVPRSVLVDLEPSTLDSIRAQPMGRMFQPQNYIHGKYGGGNNYGKGHNGEGSQLIGNIMDMLRIQAEKCDSLLAIQVILSLGGGTGSGLGSTLIRAIHEQFLYKIIPTFSLLPSESDFNHTVQIYNTVFALKQIMYCGHMTTIYDNSALSTVCSRTFPYNSPTFKDMNHLAATSIANITSGIRFRSEKNYDYRKLATNLVPFSRVHFLITSVATFYPQAFKSSRRVSAQSLANAMFDPSNIMCSVNPDQGKYQTVAGIFQGNFSTSEIEESIIPVKQSNAANFAKYIGDNMMFMNPRSNVKESQISSTLLGSSNSIKQKFQWLYQMFCASLEKKAYVHWYKSEGMDDLQFKEAKDAIKDTIGFYRNWQHVTDRQENQDEQYYQEI